MVSAAIWLSSQALIQIANPPLVCLGAPEGALLSFHRFLQFVTIHEFRVLMHIYKLKAVHIQHLATTCYFDFE